MADAGVVVRLAARQQPLDLSLLALGQLQAAASQGWPDELAGARSDRLPLKAGLFGRVGGSLVGAKGAQDRGPSISLNSGRITERLIRRHGNHR